MAVAAIQVQNRQIAELKREVAELEEERAARAGAARSKQSPGRTTW